MKKAISIFLVSVCLCNYSFGQVDSGKTRKDTIMRDTSSIRNNKTNDRNNKDSINKIRKAPPKNHTGAIISTDGNSLSQNQNTNKNKKWEATNSSSNR